MGRLIDEDDVLKVLCRELCHPGVRCPDGYCVEMREKLKDVPTAQNEFYGIEDIEEAWKFYAEEYDTNLTTNARQLKEAMWVGYEKGKQDAVHRWIPCKERLPEELSEVNVTWVNTSPEPYYEFLKGKLFTGSAVYYKGRWYWYSAVCVDYLKEYGYSPGDGMDDAIKIIAWQPLPEPYKEGNKCGWLI